MVSGQKPVSNFIALLLYLQLLVYLLWSLTNTYSNIAQALVDAEKLLEIVKKLSSVRDTASAKTLAVESGRVEFKNVNFAYPDGRPVLTDVSFEAKAEKTFTFIGESGGEKSTILKLLIRFYDV